MGWWRRRYWVLVALGVLAVLAAVVEAVDALAVVPASGSFASCGQATLSPVERPGLPWVEHRHWLELDTSLLPRGVYYIRDDDTGALFRWTFVGNVGGKARFAVQTRWTWFNPSWKAHHWTLLYDCAS